MALYFEGYTEAIQAVQNMSLEELLAQIDILYGRDNLKYGDGIEEVRQEALSQLKREFTNTDSEEYKTLQFYTGLFEKMNRK